MYVLVVQTSIILFSSVSGVLIKSFIQTYILLLAYVENLFNGYNCIKYIYTKTTNLTNDKYRIVNFTLMYISTLNIN